jgi:hypothetical protein
MNVFDVIRVVVDSFLANPAGFIAACIILYVIIEIVRMFFKSIISFIGDSAEEGESSDIAGFLFLFLAFAIFGFRYELGSYFSVDPLLLLLGAIAVFIVGLMIMK